MNKITYFLWLIIVSCSIPAGAQNVSVALGYLEKTGDYAALYNGPMEATYNSLLYENFPYYQATDFTKGDLVYKHILYPGQQVRLDLYKEQVIVLTPKTFFGVVLDSEHVDQVVMYGKTFVRIKPTKEAGLNKGFYIQLFKGNSLELLCKESYSINKKLTTIYFDLKIRYYMLLNGRYYPVKNKNSFIKLFPQYKKQINAFVKAEKLDFKRNADQSLASLTTYCEQQLTSPKNN